MSEPKQTTERLTGKMDIFKKKGLKEEVLSFYNNQTFFFK